MQSNTRLVFKLVVALLIICSVDSLAQTQMVKDDFEGNGTITSWYGDNCGLETGLVNPFSQGLNTSPKVLKYDDVGGQYANIGFNVPANFELTAHHTFSFKIYVPASSITGNQPNAVSLKLQDGTVAQPWVTQSFIVKPLVLNQWQVVTFDFLNDSFSNQDPGSINPTLRSDFNRVLIQVNGENNTDKVLAYIDDVAYDGTVTSDPVYDHLVWSDEFNTDGNVNALNWFQQSQMPGWFVNELMHYTTRPVNSYVSNGSLKIVAKRETYTASGQTKEYTSARLNSKFAFRYGKIEIRAKMAAGVGTLPALWMLGKNIDETGAWWTLQGFGSVVWPACGEIDIVEHWGNNQNYVQSATHTPSSYGNTVNLGGQTIANATTEFHTYVLNWSSKKLVFSVDGLVHYTYDPVVKDSETWPFNAEQYILMNVAVIPGVTSAFNQGTMEVDYVRVYQSATTGVEPEKTAKTWVCYPNPATDVFHIEIAEPFTGSVPVHIHSMDGRQVASSRQTVEDGRISVTGIETLPKGLYWVSFGVNGRTGVVKMVK